MHKVTAGLSLRLVGKTLRAGRANCDKANDNKKDEKISSCICAALKCHWRC